MIIMKELVKVYYISSKIRTCFFYTNNADTFIQKSTSSAIRVCFGEDFARTIYGEVSCQPLPEVPNKSIGISSLYASKLGLKEDEPILISYCDAVSLSTVQLIPVKEEDYFILLTCRRILEEHILNQVSVVGKTQILPLYVFSNIAIDVEIGGLESEFGRLEKFTEVVILHPSERISKEVDTQPKPVDSERENLSGNKQNLLEMIIKNLNNSLKNTDDNITNETVVQVERKILDKLHNTNDRVKHEYKIAPNFMIDTQIPKKIQEKFVIVSNLWNVGDADGPCSFKIFAKIQKIEINTSVKHETDVKSVKEGGKDVEEDGDDENKKEQEKDPDRKRFNSKQEQVQENISSEDRLSHVYIYVISSGMGKERTAFCPPHVMKGLGVYVGSRIIIEKADPTSDDLLPNRVKSEMMFETSSNLSNCFWTSMKSIWEGARDIVINNIRFNSRINTLILGDLGAGKSFLLNDLKQYFSDEYILCKMICCKSLRGKKMETLERIWTEALLGCCSHEPSVLILDDVHALTYFTEDEGKYNELYSNRVVDLISENLKQVQKRYNVSVIASGVSMNQLSTIVSVHGPRLFQNVQTIPNLTTEDRIFVLKNLIQQKSENQNDVEFLSAKLSNATNGFNVADLSDLVKKAILHSLLRNESNVDSVSLSEGDFELALSESTPLNLRGSNVKEKIDIKWESVGGMTEPKRVLTEIFSWPSKYSKLLESCPLRVQRGVLLYGAPGTGKTLLAGALANSCNLNFISVKGPEVLSKYVGASEEGVRNLFVQAQKTQPCLLFFDEFDSLASKRGQESSGVTDRVVNQLLTQLDGVETLSGVWVLAATSRPDLLDEALLRPGRLDKLVYCDIPSQEDRLSILEVLFENLPKPEDISLSEIAEKTKGYTGADLQALVYNAQMQAVKRNKAHLDRESELTIEQTDLLEALSETKPSLTTQEILKYEKIYRKFSDSRKGNILNDFSRTSQRLTLA